MSQKYKVYFANKPVVFALAGEGKGTSHRGCRSFRSQGKADTMLIESAIASGAREISIECQDVDASWSDFASQFELVEAAGGLVVNSRGEVLCIFRLGRWDLPKGKIEPGEDIRGAAIREVEEECGLVDLHIRTLLCTTWHTYLQGGEPMLKSTAWFLMDYAGETVPVPQEEEGITEVRWFAPDRLEEVERNTYPSVLDVLRLYVLSRTGSVFPGS